MRSNADALPTPPHPPNLKCCLAVTNASHHQLTFPSVPIEGRRLAEVWPCIIVPICESDHGVKNKFRPGKITPLVNVSHCTCDVTAQCDPRLVEWFSATSQSFQFFLVLLRRVAIAFMSLSTAEHSVNQGSDIQPRRCNRSPRYSAVWDWTCSRTGGVCSNLDFSFCNGKVRTIFYPIHTNA